MNNSAGSPSDSLKQPGGSLIYIAFADFLQLLLFIHYQKKLSNMVFFLAMAIALYISMAMAMA